MPEQERAPSEDSRLARVIRGLLVGACVVPLLHSATCARQGHEASQYQPLPELDDGGSGLRQMTGVVEQLVGLGLTLFAISLLLAVWLGGTRTRCWVSVLYGPLLILLGVFGLEHPDLHRFVWASISLLAGAILSAFVASHWLSRLRGNGPAPERRSLIAIFGACALAVLFLSVNLPAQTKKNHLRRYTPLAWTYHAAEKSDPYERIPGWKCDSHAGRCDCLRTEKPSDVGTCGEQRCCYSWNNIPWMADGPSYPVENGCFCVDPDSSRGPCPEPSSFPSLRYNSSNSRSETCP